MAISSDIIKLGAKDTMSNTKVMPYIIEKVTRALMAMQRIGSISSLTDLNSTDNKINARGNTMPSIREKSDSMLEEVS